MSQEQDRAGRARAFLVGLLGDFLSVAIVMGVLAAAVFAVMLVWHWL